MNSPLRELNPDVVFQILVRRWDILVLLPVLAVVGAVAAYKILPARYEASARLLIQDQQTVNPFRDGMVEEWSAERRIRQRFRMKALSAWMNTTKTESLKKEGFRSRATSSLAVVSSSA